MKSTTAIFLIFLSLGLFYTFTGPYYTKVQALRLVASDHQNILDNLSQIAATRDQLQLDYQAIPAEEIARLNKVLPNNIDTVRFALDLDSIAGRYGITLKNVRIDKSAEQNGTAVALPQEGKPYQETTVAFAFVSNYENFRKFLEDLERSLRIMDVKSAAFQTSDADLSEFQVSVRTYSLK